MPRKSRIDAVGALHPVMVRGIERGADGSVAISTVMRRLLTGYALWYNRRHHRSGHLFQNRFKSILCQEDVYLLELVRYIHLNPLRARLVEDLDELGRYKYSGHSVLMGRIKNEKEDVLQ